MISDRFKYTTDIHPQSANREEKCARPSTNHLPNNTATPRILQRLNSPHIHAHTHDPLAAEPIAAGFTRRVVCPSSVVLHACSCSLRLCLNSLDRVQDSLNSKSDGVYSSTLHQDHRLHFRRLPFPTHSAHEQLTCKCAGASIGHFLQIVVK